MKGISPNRTFFYSLKKFLPTFFPIFHLPFFAISITLLASNLAFLYERNMANMYIF